MGCTPGISIFTAKRPQKPYCVDTHCYTNNSAFYTDRRVPCVKRILLYNANRLNRKHFMNSDTFSKLMDFVGCAKTDRMYLPLSMMLTQGFTRAEASKASGVSGPSLSQMLARVTREADRAGRLTGVYVNVTVRDGRSTK